MEKYYKVAIVGGGIVGKSLAVALSKTGKFNKHDICLIDSQPLKINTLAPSAAFSNRVSFLAPSSISLFKNILPSSKFNLLFNAAFSPNLQQRHAWPVGQMKILDSDASPYHVLESVLGRFYSADLQFNSDNLKDPLGFIIENSVLESALDLELTGAASDVVDSYPETNFHCAEPDTTSVEEQWNESGRKFSVLRKNGEILEFNTSLLVGSDGANSKIRSLFKVPYSTFDLEQRGIVATVHVDSSKNFFPLTAYQRFLSIGPLALLPLSHDVYSIVWSVPSAFATLIGKDLSDEHFIKALNLAITGDIVDLLVFIKSPDNYLDLPLLSTRAEFSPPSILRLEPHSRASFPLKLAAVSKSTAPQVVLIGDAAHSVHPLAGQGLNMGLSDVQTLVDCLKDGLPQGKSAGDFQILEAYSKKRDVANLAMVTGMDFLFKAFTTKGNHQLEIKNIDAFMKDLIQSNFAPSIFDSVRRFVLKNFISSSPFQSAIKKLAS